MHRQIHILKLKLVALRENLGIMVPKSVSAVFNWCLAILITISLLWGAVAGGRSRMCCQLSRQAGGSCRRPNTPALHGTADEVILCCWLWRENNHSEISGLPQKCKKMGWEHKLIVLLHTAILVSVPGSTFLPRAKWKLQIHVVMKRFQCEHSAKNYKVGKTQSCVTAGWEGSALIKASSSLEEPFGVYWDHSASVCRMYKRSYIKDDLLWHFFDDDEAECSTIIPRNLISLQLKI